MLLSQLHTQACTHVVDKRWVGGGGVGGGGGGGLVVHKNNTIEHHKRDNLY